MSVQRLARTLAVARWLLTPGRPPGMLGRMTAVAGTSGQVSAIAARQGDRWLIEADGTEPTTVDSASLLQRIGDGSFVPQQVHVVPDLAELLFQEAVAQTSRSVVEIHFSRPFVEEVRQTASPLAWVNATGHLDRAVRAAVTGVVLAVATAEAQANAWGGALPRWSDDDDRLPVVDKLRQVVSGQGGHPPPRGSGHLQALARAVRQRDRLVHSKPEVERLPLTGSEEVTPGGSVSLAARRACLAVRGSLLEVAALIDHEPPHYLVYCPATPTEDERAWITAEVMAGARPDSVFPPVGSATSEP